MSRIKAKVSEEKVLQFLQEKRDEHIGAFHFIKGGELSQAFSFTSEGKDFIIRINKTDESFKKDQYASEHFASSIIPIPKIIEISNMDADFFYCISEKAAGNDLDSIKEGFAHTVYPQLIKIMDAIHTTKLSPGKYGWWVNAGEAHYDSWRDYIVKNRNYLTELYGKSMLDEEIVERTFGEVEKLAQFLPEERHLIHGDFGGNNAIYDGKKITGIIDWGNSAFGDFLFDAANQEYWIGNNMAKDVYYNHYKEAGWNVENFDKRIDCYLLYIGAGVMGFFARADMGDQYNLSKKRLIGLLG